MNQKTLFIILCSAFFLIKKANCQTIKNFSTQEGLSHNTVYHIEQDNYGFLWMATESGLSVFDGKNFNQVQSTFRDSIPSLFITSLSVNQEKKEIWVGSTKGLRIIDQKSQTISNPIRELSNKVISAIVSTRNKDHLVAVNSFGLYLINKEKQITSHWYEGSTTHPLSSNSIEKILIDNSTGLIWVCNKETGIDIINLSNNYVTTYPVGRGRNQIPSSKVYAITQDHENNIWIGTSKGLVKYDARSKTIYTIHKRAFFNATILSLKADHKGNIWIGTELNGLWKIDTNHQLSRIELDQKIKNQSIRSIYEDQQHNIWAGSQRRGIYLIPQETHSFKLLTNKDLQSEIIWGITFDNENNIWLGTDGDGIIKYNFNSKNSKHYKADASDISLSNNNILCATTDHKGGLWFGTYSGGVNKYNPEIDGFDRYDINNGLLNNDVRELFQGNDGKVWVGTNRGGLHYIDEKKNSAVSINQTRTMDIRAIAQKGNTIWLGTYGDGGIFTYHLKQNKLNKVNIPIDIEITFDLVFDHQRDILWIGTYDKGLLAYHYKKHQLEEFDENLDLSNNIIHAIQQDNNGTLWLSTNHGIIAFNYNTKVSTKYNVAEGVQANDFMDGSKSIDHYGNIYFGGADGLNYFNPQKIKPATESPEVIITKLEVFNKVIEPNDASQVLDLNISDSDEIVLNHAMQQFSLSFQGIDINNAEAIQYKYFMKGLDRDWNLIGKNNSANYSNLPSGNYTFLVSAKSVGGPWSAPTELGIKITPPFWATWWANIIYFSIFLGIILYWKNFTNKRAKMKVKLQLQEKQTLMHKENKQVYEDIIDELTTPINQVVMPLENMIHNSANTTPAIRRQLQTLYFNASKIHNIIRFILGNKKRETQEFKLEVYQYNLKTFINNFKESFELQAAQQGITIETKLYGDNLTGWFDIEKIETVLHFIFSTVFQNAQSGNQILITIETKGGTDDSIGNISIYLLDENGKTMPINFQKRKTAQIGIPMSEWYLKHHKGALILPTESDQKISLSIPISKKAYSANEIKLDEDENNPYYLNKELFSNDEGEIQNQKLDFKLAILDDNKESNIFLKNILSEYHIATFNNSVEFFQHISKNEIDLILIDNTLKEGNGIDIIKKTKKDGKLAIIPIILLESNLTEKHKVSGLVAGADLCISKPFHISVLKTHVQNLIHSRQYFKNIYRTEILTNTKEVVPVNEDEKLIAAVKNLIEDNISNPDFNVQSIQDEIGISQSALYKKVKQQTGKSSSEFLRDIRLKYAAQLLKKSNLPISEVMHKVGFLDAKYFRTTFKKKYDMSPSQYRKEEEAII